MGRRPAGLLLAVVLACAGGTASDPHRYRLTGSGTHWDVVGSDRVLADLQPRYPEFFAIVLDPARTDEADLRELRDDLERAPVDRRNYDALNAVAIAYFELNYRGEQVRHEAGLGFLSAGFRTAKLVAVPWRAYGEIQDGPLREAILDFFADIARGEKLESRRTRGRITRIVGSLANKESDPGRLARIRRIHATLEQAEAELAD